MALAAPDPAPTVAHPARALRGDVNGRLTASAQVEVAPTTNWTDCHGDRAAAASPNAAARALLHHLLENGDITGRDAAGRTIIQLAVDDRVLETLMTFDAEAADLEPEPDEEADGPPVVVELVRAKMVERWAASGCD